MASPRQSQLALPFDAGLGAGPPAPRTPTAAPPASGAPPVRKTMLSREGHLLARMTRALEARGELVLTDNRRRMISSRRLADRIEVRLHHMFLDAPEAIVDELLAYLADGDRRASAAIGRYIEQNKDRITRRKRRILLRTRGRHHDLAEILGEVRAILAGEDTGAVRITWGKMPPGTRRRSIRFGTYTHDHELIRIHPALDQASVPRFFVAFVVFHELLHHVVPAKRGGSRVEYHPREFRARERAHPDYARAIAWEEANIDMLLRWRG